jgi:hypothetical protein
MLHGFRFQTRYTSDVIAQLDKHLDKQVLVHYLWQKDACEETSSFLCVKGVSYRIVMDKGRFVKEAVVLDDNYDGEYVSPHWVRYPIELVECDLPADVIYDTSKYFDLEIPEDSKLLMSRLLRLTHEDLIYCAWLDRNTVII